MMQQHKIVVHIMIVMLFWVAGLFAQNPDTLWTKTYGGILYDKGYSVQVTSDNGYVIAGQSKSFGVSDDVYLIKTNGNGDTIWTKTYGDNDNDCGNSVEQTTDGGYIVAGHITTLSNSGDVYLVKTDSLGDTLWTKAYGGTGPDEAYSVQQTSDNGYIVAGNTMSFGPSLFNIYLLKTDSLGDTLWTKAYGWGFLTYCYSVQVTSDSCYVIAGISQPYGEAPDVCLVKTDANGDILWTQSYGGNEYDWAYSFQQTSDNGYIITGFTDSYGAGDNDVYLIKTDSIGDTLWTKTYGGSNDEEGLSVKQTTDGGYFIAGYTKSFGAGSKDVYLIKTDSIGDTLWTKVIGGSGGDEAHSVQEISEDEYIIAGYTSSFGSGYSDVYLIRIGYEIPDTLLPVVQVTFPNGNEFFGTGDTCDITWIATDNIGVDSIDIFYSTDAGGSWDVIATGEPNDSLYEWIVPNTPSDSCLVKILAYDPSLNIGEDQSDSLFTISPEGINEDISSVHFVLLQCTPNPFRDKIDITLSIGQGAESIELKIYDVSGRIVKVFNLTSGFLPLASTVCWDGVDDSNRKLPNGVYFCRLSVGDHHLTKKLLLLQ